MIFKRLNLICGVLSMKTHWSGYNFIPQKIICSIMILYILLFLFTGCTYIQLRKETKILECSTILVGTVSSNLNSWEMPVIVVAYSKEKNKRTIVHYTTLHELGPYELLVPKGNYHVVAFGDKNKNLIYEKGEPAGQYVGAEYVSAPVGGVVQDLDVVISDPKNAKVDFPVGSKIPPKRLTKFHSTMPGAIANLDDELFSDEYGQKAYWTPLEFFKEVGGNIYFLQAYDPQKIPILFVHGAAGSPQNWKTFFETIDSNKFQPWLYYYPSGASLESMSYLLFWKIYNLQRKYKFRELYITAHSMGGLVVRSFLTDFGHIFPSITRFISISTPWGGEEFTELGVKYSPAVIPAWKDMQPESEFIKSIFQKKLPPTLEHYLFFGHKGNRNPLRPNNDNAVTLMSQLDQRAQAEAKMIYGFHEDHVSILSSAQVLAQYNAILYASFEKDEQQGQVPGNKLLVEFSFDFPEELPKSQPILLLRPVDKEQSEIQFYFIRHEDSGREIGPFPAGNYNASLVASAFVSDPVSIPITIKTNTISIAKFSLKPRGILEGKIVDTEKNNNSAGIFRRADDDVKIQSITLKGEGIVRTPTPLKDKDVNYFDHYLSGSDYASKGLFYFYDLPAGKYQLTINAEGYEQYTASHDVLPGQYDFKAIELMKKNANPLPKNNNR